MRLLIGIAVVTTVGCDRSPGPSTGTTSASASTKASSSVSGTTISSAPSTSSIASALPIASASTSAAPSGSATSTAKAQLSLEGPIGEACKAWASARCAATDRCAHPFLVIDSGDVPRCEGLKAVECVSVAAAEGSGATAASITACAKEIKDVACSALDRLPPTGACAPPKGSRPDDASCIDDEQCASGFCGRSRGSSTCGACKPAATTGASCGKTYCAVGYSCVSSTCQRRAELGGACSGTGASGSCQPWLSCVAGKCATPENAVGAACSSLGDAPDCDWRLGLYCDDLSNKCKAATVAKEGESCASDDGTMHICAGGLICRRADQKSGSRCVVRPKAGEACDEAKGLYCASPYRCLGSKCAIATIADCK